MTEPYKIHIEIGSTWMESSGEYPRSVGLAMLFEREMPDDVRGMKMTYGSDLRDELIKKFKDELGIVHLKDYIFSNYDYDPVLKNGVWHPAPPNQKVIIKMRDEEHYAMFKLHYSG